MTRQHQGLILVRRSGLTRRRLMISYLIQCVVNSLATPQVWLGCEPIVKTIFPPRATVACGRNTLFQGLPFSVTDCTYMFCADKFSATTTSFFPLDNCISARGN